ncbi:unnamed protein product [Moneuplotes crassus]|uniref:Thioredoxin domain-containing protein n=1 Tax=Euplotes crassus TaxID=5936 RepID=A0AAD2D7X0_EUPCR|nr:unnamed protein product [Moneuplotes crassus]
MTLLAVALAIADKVTELEEKDFVNGRVLNKNAHVKGKWFIKFYVPWCPHCQRLAPEWEEMAGEIDEEVNVGAVNCSDHDDLSTFYGVYSYPTIYYIDDSLGMVKYQGMRSAEDLSDYINNQDYLREDSSKIKDIEKFREISTLEKFKGMFGLD